MIIPQIVQISVDNYDADFAIICVICGKKINIYLKKQS